MILGVCVRKITVSFALVVHNHLFFFFFPSSFLIYTYDFNILKPTFPLDQLYTFFLSADLLRPDSSVGEEFERLAVSELLEVALKTVNPSFFHFCNLNFLQFFVLATLGPKVLFMDHNYTKMTLQ